MWGEGVTVRRRWLWLVLLVPVVLVVGFVIWAETPLGPMPEALSALQSDEAVQVATSPWLVFEPAGSEPAVGIILYPGGRVDPRSYAPEAHALAAEGYLAVIAPMPFNLAVFAPDRAVEVMAAFPSVRHWAVGGHSLGGAMAARFAYRHPEAVEGLVLWAAYPASTDDLSTRNLQVVSIFGTQDGLATGDKIDASRPLLPPTTRWVSLEGGNHAGFGWYGPQPGDGTAAISRQDQQSQAVAATIELLQSLAREGQ
jgi:dienelactone hydrolase